MLMRCAACGHPYWRTRQCQWGMVGVKLWDVGSSSVRFGLVVKVCSTCAAALIEDAVELFPGGASYNPAVARAFTPLCSGLPPVRWSPKPGYDAQKGQL